MKNAIVKLGFCLLILFFCAGHVAFAAAPTVTVTQASADPTNSSTIVFNVVFSESVTGFGNISGDVLLSGAGASGAAGAVTGSGSNYTITVTGHTVNGPITVSIPAGAAQNGTAENNVASAGGDPTVTYDGTKPNVTINKKGTQTDPTSTGPIRFTVVFNEPINATTFTAADINLSSSTTGAGTLTVAGITVVTPDTDFEVEVTVSGSAVAGDVIASIPAGSVDDLVSNSNNVSTSTDNSVQYITAPVMGPPTVTGLMENEAAMGGSITSTGGAAITGRGVYYDTNPNVTTADTQDPNASGLTPFSETITGLTDETHYYFKAYATNSVGTTLSSEGEFWTLSAAPASAPTPTLSATSTTAIHITFPAASTIANTEGYVILRKVGSEPPVTDLPDGIHPDDLDDSSLPANSTLVAIITDQSQTFIDDTGLNPCTDYYYVAVLYNWDLTNPGTTNYRYGGVTFNEARAGTWCNASDIQINGPSATLNFASKTGATITTAADGLEVFPLRLRDGGATNDVDDRKTEIASITISIDHPELLQAVAYIDGAYVQSQAAAASMVFNIPSNTTLADDDNDNDFSFYATFVQTPVVDQTPIVFTVTAATVRTGVNQAGSGFATANAGGATTGPTNNRVDVIASKLVFSNITDPINPNGDFTLTITARDVFDNVDTNGGGSVTLSMTVGTGTFTSTDVPGGLTRTLASGTTTWTLLRFTTASAAGSPKTVKADHSGAIPDAFQNLDVESLGAIITGPTTTLCFNNSSTSPTSFATLGQIKIKESDGSDFSTGSNQTFSLLLPDGFIFDIAATPTVGAVGTDINTPAFVGYTGNNVVRVKYNISGAGGVVVDELTIDNLKVKYTGTTVVTSQPITRVGGSAVQEGNADTDAKPHGLLSSGGNPNIVLDFENVNAPPTQTSFSKLSGTPIELRGLKTNAPSAILTGPTAVFSGNGVSLDGGVYKFTPSSVSNGNHDITFTYADPVAPGCFSTVTKTYTVFSSIINGLQTSYCINDAPTNLTTPVGSAPFVLQPCPGLPAPAYNNFNYVYKYYDYTFGYQNLPGFVLGGNTPFNPSHPAFADEVLDGYIEVSVWYNNVCNGSQTFVAYTFVRIYPKPTISFSPTFDYGVCASDAAYNMSGFPYTPANNFDEFWSSQSGAPGTPAPGITGDRATGFKFEPQLANATASDKVVQINYTHKDVSTGCVNEIALDVNVWAKPAQVPASSIFIRDTVTPDISGEFCYGEGLTPFTTTAVPSVIHKWNLTSLARPPVEGDEFALSPNDFPNTGGVPNIGAVVNYQVTQIVHRQFGPHPIFPFITVQTFPGCESNVRNLTVEIMEPTTVEAGDDAVICEGNDLNLSLLSAEINSPTAGLDGTWISTTGGADGYFYKDTQANPQASFLLATHYHPSQVEIDARLAILRLTTNEPNGPCGPVTDLVFITINPGVTVSFPVSPVEVCSTTSISVEGKVSNAALDFAWTVVSGGGAISAGTENNLTTTYLPTTGLQDFGGTVKLKLATEDPDGPGPCVVVEQVVDVIISQKPKIDAGPDYDICADQPILLNGSIDDPISSASNGTWTHDGAGSINNTTALLTQYDPDNVEDPGAVADPNSKKITFTLTSNVPGGGNVCPAETDVVTITIHARPELPQPGSATPPTYCVGQNVDLLRATGTSLTWYDNTLSQISTGPSLSTGVVADAEKKVTFHVSQTFDKLAPFPGCESAKTPITITVNPLPVPAFDFAEQCLGDYMKFKDRSTIAQPSVGTRSIVSWQWNFDDGLGFTDAGAGPIPPGTQDDRTLGAYDSLRHIFRNTGLYNVRLAVVTSDGCTAVLTHAPIKVGEIPEARFASRLVCDQDNTQFMFTGADPGAGTTFSYAWDFGDPSSGSDNASVAKNPAHQFTGVNTYDVTLTVTTDLDCENSITSKTSILPYINAFPYIETFESTNHGWVSQGFPETSWNLSTGTNHIAPNPASAAGSTFWVTNTDVNGQMTYNNSERSVLYGPCVDMTTLDRPVLAMDYWSDTEPRGDGAYVEVMDESLANPQWIRLGASGSGLNWYNENSIGGLAKTGNVGQDIGQFGWSGVSDTWKTGRFNLDQFADRTRLRFRIVFGSNGSQPLELFDGFALDYFKLETRNRLVLIENFTARSTSTAVTGNSSAFNKFPSVGATSEVVKIEYHTGLPAVAGDPVDPIFSQNPMDPNARASFYGLSAVPRAYIDGYTNAGTGLLGDQNGNINSWASNEYNTESLVTSPLDIVINTPTITNGVINITGTVTTKEFDLKANQYSLYVAVVEQTVGNDSYVLRKMLPSASGRKVPATATGQTFTFDESWSIDKSNLTDNPTLVAVAFVQSDIITDAAKGTKQVLQAAYNDNLPVINFTTGVELPLLEQTALYPNPADRILNIELPTATASGVDVKVIDQLGRPVILSAIGAGERSTTIDTGGLAAAVYIVQLKENGIYTNRRLVITHRH
jgi:hypothetical protein